MTSKDTRHKLLGEMISRLSAFTLEWSEKLHIVGVETKGPADYVSHVDREAEMIARDMIQSAFPSDTIVGEEHGGDAGNSYWVIDPIDGTVNFLSGLPFWAVSIAYVEDGEPTLGAIALPAMGVVMSAAEGEALHIEGNYPALGNNRAKAFATGRNNSWPTQDRVNLETALEKAGYHVVNLGSCASSLALVAAGRLAGYVEREIQLWDCAAGYVLCKSAGIKAELEFRESDFTAHIAATWDRNNLDVAAAIDQLSEGEVSAVSEL